MSSRGPTIRVRITQTLFAVALTTLLAYIGQTIRPPRETSLAITGFAVALATGCLFYLLSVQMRIGANDRQKLAATTFVYTLLAICIQLMLSYFGWTPSMGSSARGVIFFTAWAISIAWLAWETKRYNDSHSQVQYRGITRRPTRKRKP